ncbi:hypothetical protein HDU96_006345 [Phlyctochytrium bullatum]|nr:hypothetical protein HDU96_006345 [Phlyctochytrium bullatum]
MLAPLALLASVLALAPSSALAAFSLSFGATSTSVTVSARQAGASTEITVTASNLAESDWIGIGIPVDRENPVAAMSAGELIVLTPAGEMIYSAPVSGHAFAPTEPSDLSLASSSYSGNTLTAVLTTSAGRIPTGDFVYFGAVGPLSGSSPRRHYEHQATRGTLLEAQAQPPAPPAPAASSSSETEEATTSTTAASTTSTASASSTASSTSSAASVPTTSVRSSTTLATTRTSTTTTVRSTTVAAVTGTAATTTTRSGAAGSQRGWAAVAVAAVAALVF